MDLADLHVMVVDDFPPMRKLLIKSLRQMGASRILEARDGTEAVQLMNLKKVDLILSDWNMPDMGGLELLRWVRDKHPWGHMPFLMVTSRGQQLDVVEAVKAGVDSYIVKPFTQEGLEEKVAKLVPQAAQFADDRAAALEAATAAEPAEASPQALEEPMGASDPPNGQADLAQAAEAAAGAETQDDAAPAEKRPSIPAAPAAPASQDDKP